MKIFLLACFLFVAPFWVSAQMDEREKALSEWIDQHNAEAIDLLKTIINTNSGTMNFEGVKQVAETLMPEFEALGMEVKFTDGAAFNRAGHLVAKIEGGKGPKVLMIGHLDTVFEPDSPFQSWEQVDENTIKGPGIADMKGGDIIILQALKALHAQGLLKDMNIWVVMTGDEEMSGRPLSLSKAALVEAAKWADIALGFENGDGNPATVNVARRSSTAWKLEVTGNPSHSSQVFKPEVGAGAVFEASRILYQFYTELAGEKFLTFNPGNILGGTQLNYNDAETTGTVFGKTNVVAERVVVNGDIRCLTDDQLQNAKMTMQRIVTDSLPGTQAILTFEEGYPPFAPTDGNYVLMNAFSQVSTDLGFGEVKPVDPADAGAADISFTSQYIEMGIDGMGMSGSDDHTINETGKISALPMQAKRTAVLLYRMLKGSLAITD